jgi:hypothetical protein
MSDIGDVCSFMVYSGQSLPLKDGKSWSYNLKQELLYEKFKYLDNENIFA